MGVVYFSIIPTFEPSRYCKCWIVCFYNKTKNIEFLDLILINEYICIIFCSLKVYFNGINSNYLVQTGC